MQTPAFFDQVTPIVVQDALAQALGAVHGGLIEYRYVEAVKLAGHSCPTLTGAWLMIRAALARLHPAQTPRRGELRVEAREAEDAGVAGVIASVASLVIGAAGGAGFKGLAGRHAHPGTAGETARVGRKHQRLREQSDVVPAMSCQARADRKHQADWCIEGSELARRLPRTGRRVLRVDDQ